MRGDAGYSLTELLVVMFILSIIIATTATLTIGMWRTNSDVMARQDQVDTARAAVERMSKTLRTAVKPSQLIASCPGCVEDAFIKAGTFSMQFYANLDNPNNSVGPSRVSYAVATTGTDAGVLIEKVQRPDSNQATATGFVYCDAEAATASQDCKDRLTTRRLAEGVVVTTGPLFRYFNDSGVEMLPGTVGLSSADIARLLSTEITLNLKKPGGNAINPTTYIQRIMLPNTQAVLRPW